MDEGQRAVAALRSLQRRAGQSRTEAGRSCCPGNKGREQLHPQWVGAASSFHARRRRRLLSYGCVSLIHRGALVENRGRWPDFHLYLHHTLKQKKAKAKTNTKLFPKGKPEEKSGEFILFKSHLYMLICSIFRVITGLLMWNPNSQQEHSTAQGTRRTGPHSLLSIPHILHTQLCVER